MKICRQHRLYDGIIFVHNRAILDFVTPLKEMLAEIAKFVDSEQPLSDEAVDLGNKLLVYLSCCLCGHQYPSGDLPEKIREKVTLEAYQFLTQDPGTFWKI